MPNSIFLSCCINTMMKNDTWFWKASLMLERRFSSVWQKQVVKLPSYEISVQNHTSSLTVWEWDWHRKWMWIEMWLWQDVGGYGGLESPAFSALCVSYCCWRPHPDCVRRMSDLYSKVIYFVKLSQDQELYNIAYVNVIPFRFRLF